MGVILDLKTSEKPAFCRMQLKKHQHVIDVEKTCVPSARAIKAKQSDVPVYQSRVAI